MAQNNAVNNSSAPFTVTSGDLTISAGNLDLPTTTSTAGSININGTRFLTQAYDISNTFVGWSSGNYTLNNKYNTAIGAATMSYMTSGYQNSAFGYDALGNITQGGNNVGNGYSTLNNLLTGNNNTCVGSILGGNYTSSESNNIIIGYNIGGTAGESNVIRIGNSSNNACYIQGIEGVSVSNLNVVTINTSTGQLGSQAASSGTVTSVSGTTNQVSVASGTTTPVISLVGPYTPATYTTHGVLIGEGTSSIVALGAGTSGQVLQSGGASADPSYSTPTYPSASGTSRTILVSNGTNNVYSTETWAVPGASGNVLTSDGTNWTSATPSGLTTTTGSLTNAQIKLLHTTPISLISAPGSGKINVVVSSVFKMVYGGTNAFTDPGGSGISLTFTSATTYAFLTAIPSSILTSTASQISLNTPNGNVGSGAYATAANAAIYANCTSSNPAGNAAANNTVSWSISYYTVTI